MNGLVENAVNIMEGGESFIRNKALTIYSLVMEVLIDRVQSSLPKFVTFFLNSTTDSQKISTSGFT